MSILQSVTGFFKKHAFPVIVATGTAAGAAAGALMMRMFAAAALPLAACPVFLPVHASVWRA